MQSINQDCNILQIILNVLHIFAKFCVKA